MGVLSFRFRKSGLYHLWKSIIALNGYVAEIVLECFLVNRVIIVAYCYRPQRPRLIPMFESGRISLRNAAEYLYRRRPISAIMICNIITSSIRQSSIIIIRATIRRPLRRSITSRTRRRPMAAVAIRGRPRFMGSRREIQITTI